MISFLGIGFSETERKYLREKISPGNDFQFCSHPREAVRKHQKSYRDIFLLENNFSSEDTSHFINQIRKIHDDNDGAISLLVFQRQSYSQNLIMLQKTADDIFYLQEDDFPRITQPLQAFLKRNQENLFLRRTNYILSHEHRTFEQNVQQLLPHITEVKLPPTLHGATPSSESFREKLKFCAFDAQPSFIRAEHKQCAYEAARFTSDVRSERFKGTTIEIDFSATPDFLHNYILWGEKKGAVQGKKLRPLMKVPLSEEKNAISVILHNIEALTRDNQSKLVKYLRSRSERVKSKQLFIITTSANLEKSVQSGKFRHDLFYHLQLNPVTFPTLKSRKEDIVTISKAFLSDSGFRKARSGKNTELKLESAKLVKAENYSALFEILHKLLYQSMYVGEPPGQNSENQKIFKENIFSEGKPLSLNEMEKQYICSILQRYHGNMSDTAKSLGIARKTLYDKIKKYGIISGQYSKSTG